MINHNVVRCAVPSLPPSSRISRGRHVILRAPFFNLRFSTISPFSTSLKANSYRVTIPESQVLRYGKIGPVPTRVTVPASPGDAVLVDSYEFRTAPTGAVSSTAAAAAGADRRVLGVSRLNCRILRSEERRVGKECRSR